MGVDFERGIAVLDAFVVSLEIEVAERPVGEVAWIVAVDVDGLGVVGEGLGVVLPLVGLVSHLFVFLSCAVVLDVHLIIIMLPALPALFLHVRLF